MRDESELKRLLGTIPLLADRPFAEWSVTPLAGLTNRSWRLIAGECDVVLRITGASADRYLNRADEFHNTGIAAELGIAPPLLYADTGGGVTVQEYQADARALTPADFAAPKLAYDMGVLLGRLHRSSREFAGTMSPFPAIDLYLSLASDARLRDLRRHAEPLRQALEADPRPMAPSHIDPNPGNVLRLPDGALRLIDWEFSAMCEPAWDLAAVTIEADLSPESEDAMLAGYGGGDSPAWRDRIWLMRAALHLVAGSWTYAEIAGGNAAPGLPVLLDRYLSNLERTIRSPEWSRRLQLSQG